MSEQLRRYMALKYEQEGVLDRESIYEDVKKLDHPLHNRYEWNREKAAKLYVLDQIAADIRYIQETWVTDDGRTERTRTYLANSEIGRPTPGYIAARDALTDPAVLEFMSKSLDLEINNMRRRFGHLVEYAEKLRLDADRAEAEARRVKRAPRKKKT